jgi:hypothetical protein
MRFRVPVGLSRVISHYRIETSTDLHRLKELANQLGYVFRVDAVVIPGLVLAQVSAAGPGLLEGVQLHLEEPIGFLRREAEPGYTSKKPAHRRKAALVQLP